MNNFQRRWKKGELLPGQTMYVKRLHTAKMDYLENVTLKPDGFDHLPKKALSYNAYSNTCTRFYSKRSGPASRIYLNIKDDPVFSPRAKRRWLPQSPPCSPQP